MRPLFAILLFSLPAFAADPAGIRLPVVNAPTPMQLPAAAVSSLKADHWYVIDASVECVVRAHPADAVKVTKKKGPRDISAKFADGNGAVEDRSYEGPFLYVVTAAKTARVSIDVIPLGFKAESEIKSITLDVTAGEGPRPPPIDDDAKPKPGPFSGKFSMIVIEETTDAANNRGQFFADKDLQAYLAAKLVGKARIADKDVVDATGQPPKDLVPYLNRAKGKALPQVYLVAPDGTVLMEGDLPKTPAELLAALRKVGG